jgi:hypothetical protein
MDEQSPPQSPPAEPNPFIGILMRCCRTYVRAYLNAIGDSFVGRCPLCGGMVRVKVADEGGSPNQFFEAW